nr:hypothetical protein [Terriglobus saanensis]
MKRWNRSVMDGSGHAECFFPSGKDDPGPHKYELSRRRGIDSIASFTNKKRISNVILKSFDLVADGRLGAQYMLGCSAEVLALGNRNQIFQMAKLDNV